MVGVLLGIVVVTLVMSVDAAWSPPLGWPWLLVAACAYLAAGAGAVPLSRARRATDGPRVWPRDAEPTRAG